MYGFVDPKGKGNFVDKATEALIWNGKTVDDEIAGFRTLTVEGRENVNYDINRAERPQDGDVEMATSLASNTIKINFQLKAKDSKEFNKSWYALKLLVRGSKQKFTFADEKDTYRYGTPKSIINEKSGVYETTGYIEIYQSDPKIYRPEKSTGVNADGANPIIFSDKELLKEVRPNRLSFVFNLAIGAPAITFTDPLTNEKYTVQVTVPVVAGDTVTVRFDTGRAYLNGKYVSNALSIGSDIGNFKLSDGMVTDNSNQMLRRIIYFYSPELI